MKFKRGIRLRLTYEPPVVIVITVRKYKTLGEPDLKSDRQKGILLLLATAILWSMGGIFIKTITWNGYAVAGLRSLVAAITILFFIKKPSFKFTPARIASILAYAGTVCFFTIATKQTTAANAILLQYTAPIYAAILGFVFLKEPIKKRDIFSIIVIFAGMLIFLSDSLSVGHLYGDILGLLSGVAFGTLSVTLRLEKSIDPLQNVFWGNILSFFIMLPFMGSVTFTQQNTIFILILGIFQLGLPYILYTKGIQKVTALEGTIIPVLEPILNPVWVILFQGEIPSFATILGGLIVVLGVTGREVINRILKSREKIIQS